MGEILSIINSYVWGLPLLFFLLTANIILLFHSRFVPFLGFRHAITLLTKKEKVDYAKGELTHFEALSNALAATIGLGNISGVAVAIYQGGAGAIFWMWIAALLGMNTKFFECTLAVLFKGENYRGEQDGGPMYYIEQGLNPRLKFLAYFFSICGLIGTLALFQTNQLSVFLAEEFDIANYLTGGICAALICYILFGGLKRIAQFTSKVVPIMSVFYFLLCVTILILNLEKVPTVFASIFYEALTGKSIAGGALGYSIMFIIQTGVKRAAFSNEAGIGTAPMAHGNAKTNEPISEGYVAMLGPFIDTIVICTLTALTILVSLDGSEVEVNGILLTSQAFQKSLGLFGKVALGVIILLFSFSTMIGMANYNRKCWNYLFKGRWGLGEKAFICYYIASIVWGAMIKMSAVVDLIDIAYALMAIPNIIATLLLASKVKAKLTAYNHKFKI